MPCANGSMRSTQAVIPAGDVVKRRCAVFIHQGKAQVKDRPEDLDDAIRVPGHHHLLPAPLAESLQPDPGPRLTAQAVAHGYRLVGVGIQVVLEQGFNRRTALHGQPFPGLHILHVGEQQVGG